MTKERVTVYLTSEVAKALHAASLAAGGYGQKSAIVERALRRELGMVEHDDAQAETLTWLASLWGGVLGKGTTKEAAIAAAVREYEDKIGYNQDIPDRETLIRLLSVGIADE